MPIFHLETERAASGQGYDLFRVLDWAILCDNFEDYIETKDRLYAAIVNVGIACRYCVDHDLQRATIRLKTDKDGKFYRYENEHNILFNLLNPVNIYEARKHASLYGEYQKYLERIRQYIRVCNLFIEISD